MHFVVIGEVSSRIPEDFKKENPQIPLAAEMLWPRNRIAHDYFGVDYEIVWDIIQNNLASLAHRFAIL